MLSLLYTHFKKVLSKVLLSCLFLKHKEQPQYESSTLPKLELEASFLPTSWLKQAGSSSFHSVPHCCQLCPKSAFSSALWRFGCGSKSSFRCCRSFIKGSFLTFSILFAWHSPGKIFTEKLSALWYFQCPSCIHSPLWNISVSQVFLWGDVWYEKNEILPAGEVMGKNCSERRDFPGKPEPVTLGGR